jgi:dihydropteroate synthase
MRFARIALDWSRVYVVGVLNVTPDSFSDGGLWAETDAAIARGRALVAAGADVVDVGGCSTRPGADPVPEAVEIDRVVPVIEALGDVAATISVDTTSAEVARRAVAAGAEIINDISAAQFDREMAAAIAETGAVWVAGHARGRDIAAVHAAESAPPTVDEVIAELAARLAEVSGARRVIADPGVGFGKRGRENLELMKGAGRIADALQCPVMLGPSRKRFLEDLPGAPPGISLDRDDATVGVALAAAACGAHFVRVHAVDRVRAALCAFEAVVG